MLPYLEASTAYVRQAPSINGQLVGSIHQMTGTSAWLNSGGVITGDWLVPGTPNVQTNGDPTFASIIEGTGQNTPGNYTIGLNSGATVGRIIRRSDPLTLPLIESYRTPTGNRWVTVNSNGQSVGNWNKLAGLTLNSNTGNYAVPAGNYAVFTANSGSSFTLGEVGSNTPTVYSFQGLNLNNGSDLKIAGPVILILQNGVNFNGTAGNIERPDWLEIHVHNGSINFNTNSQTWAVIKAPKSQININGNLTGMVYCDGLTINHGGKLTLSGAPSTNPPECSIYPIALPWSILMGATEGSVFK